MAEIETQSSESPKDSNTYRISRESRQKRLEEVKDKLLASDLQTLVKQKQNIQQDIEDIEREIKARQELLMYITNLISQKENQQAANI